MYGKRSDMFGMFILSLSFLFRAPYLLAITEKTVHFYEQFYDFEGYRADLVIKLFKIILIV